MTERIRKIIEALPGGFEADWTMTFTDEETNEEYTTFGADDWDAERPEAAAYWADVTKAIEQAIEYEGEARDALENEDFQAALEALQNAAECEHPDGSGGTYDEVISLVVSLLADREDDGD